MGMPSEHPAQKLIKPRYSVHEIDGSIREPERRLKPRGSAASSGLLPAYNNKMGVVAKKARYYRYLSLFARGDYQ
jgi:hypothetical protein